MVDSSLNHPPKVTKHKVTTRIVSSLTPSQLARKRAHDREAQRKIRQRTKDHIHSLERDLEELKVKQNHSQAVQDLELRNKVLQDELTLSKKKVSVLAATLSYHAPSALPLLHGMASLEQNESLAAAAVYEPTLHNSSSTVIDSCSSYSSPNDHESLCENWDTSITPPLVTSSVSSPWVLFDDCSTAYVPATMPVPVLLSNNMSTPRAGNLRGNRAQDNKNEAKVAYYNKGKQNKTASGG
ncbi:hypothetical protein NW762_014578 [Fusarium torreyae]|uniref:BZIP domain-containing protein n=1 Tax=Fusarium torreyae TaxID=1237075 RepID=A0A9W8V6M4_9HYPO|nr:hypothetical protein NW762_014578 [Fusarium torreyae]